jgi:hypothetical protein
MADCCRSCKAPIRWAITENGRLMPLDLEPADDGNIRLAAALEPGGTPRCAVVPEAHRAALAGELYVPHFSTCPYAHEHRRRG